MRVTHLCLIQGDYASYSGCILNGSAVITNTSKQVACTKESFEEEEDGESISTAYFCSVTL